MALRAFGDGTETAEWLSQPSGLFDGQSPLFAATTSDAGCARIRCSTAWWTTELASGLVLAADDVTLAADFPTPAQMVAWPATAALYAALKDVMPELHNMSGRDRALVLRDAVSAAVDELRPTGRTCERIVMLIRCLATEAGIENAHVPEAIDEIEAWCVQRFYAPARPVSHAIDTIG